MKKQKVLVLNYEYPPLGGGAATATYNLLEQLKKEKDINVTLLTSSVGKYEEEDVGRNIKIIRLDIGKEGDLHNQSNKNLLKYSFKAFRWMLRNRKEYDLIHAFFGIPCGFLAMLIGKPYIVSLRGSDVPFYSKKYEKLDKYIFQHLSKLIWKRAKYVVANSEGLRDLAYETYDKKDIGVIYNGVDTNMFKPKGKGEGFTIVSTSRLTERKGLNYLIEAFGEFQKGKDNVRLIFYGDGDQREELESMVGELNIQDKTKFEGEASREDIAESIPRCHVFVLPSKNEGMSNSLLEAMASGLAIIATDVGGTKELVDSSNGIVVEKENSREIKEGLERLYNDRELVNRMGRESRKKAEVMSWERMGQSYFNLYKEING
jgi:glycosyltransferase involved in cell wall biosynthesis